MSTLRSFREKRQSRGLPNNTCELLTNAQTGRWTSLWKGPNGKQRPIPQPETKRGHELQNERSGLQKIQLSLGGPCPALLSASGPCQWTGQEKAKRGFNPLQSDNGGGGGKRRKECTDSPPHPSPASNLSSGILQPSLQGRRPRGQGAGYCGLRAPTPPPLPLSISYCGRPRRVAQTLAVRPRTADGLRALLTEEPRRVLLGGAGCGGREAVNSGRRPGWLPGWVHGSEIPSPGAGRSGKAAAESRLGLGALRGPSLLLDPAHQLSGSPSQPPSGVTGFQSEIQKEKDFRNWQRGRGESSETWLNLLILS